MRRREFIALLGAAVIASSRDVIAQRTERVRRIGMLVNLAESDYSPPLGQEHRIPIDNDDLNALTRECLERSIQVIGRVNFMRYKGDAQGLCRRFGTTSHHRVRLTVNVNQYADPGS